MSEGTMVVTDLKCSLTCTGKKRRARTDHDAVHLPRLILAFDSQIRILAIFERPFCLSELTASNCRICSLCQRRNGPLHLQLSSMIWHVGNWSFVVFTGGSKQSSRERSDFYPNQRLERAERVNRRMMRVI